MGARRRPLQPCRGGRASAGSVLGAVVFEAGLVCLLLLGSWQDEGINGAREHIATGATVAEIHGAVHDEHGSVEGAVVRIQATGNATSTDNTGRFLLTDLDPGAPVTVNAWKQGYYCAKVDDNGNVNVNDNGAPTGNDNGAGIRVAFVEVPDPLSGDNPTYPLESVDAPGPGESVHDARLGTTQTRVADGTQMPCVVVAGACFQVPPGASASGQAIFGIVSRTNIQSLTDKVRIRFKRTGILPARPNVFGSGRNSMHRMHGCTGAP